MSLSDADKRMLPMALREAGGFHQAAKWYLRGFTCLPYQWAFHQLQVMNTTLLGGIAVGKTRIVAASNLIDCISQSYFGALNTAVTAKQSELAFDMVMAWIEGNERLEHLIYDIKLRPFPIIFFKNYSTYTFRTAGTDGRFIRGSEYDRIGFDEPGLDMKGEIIKVLRGRARGSRTNGVPRTARVDVFGSPTEAPWLRERFERGLPSAPEYHLYRSMRVTTWMNTFLGKDQIAAMEAEYTPDMLAVEMGAEFPDYGMSFIPSRYINGCLDTTLYDRAYLATHPDPDEEETRSGKALAGYTLDEDPRHGIIKYEVPPRPGRIYVASGDPGVDSYPKRNAPVVMVADVTDHKKKELVYFDWGSGKGSYKPFLQSYRYAIEKYDPILKAIDATGTQKALDELGFEDYGIETDKLNFVSDKTGMLNALSLDLSNYRWRYPTIKGLMRQLGTYTIVEDKKLAQDIVMVMAGLSHIARMVPTEPGYNDRTARANHRSRTQRTTAHGGRRR